MSAMMVDAAYYDLYKAMKPGMRENEAVALVAERLYDLGSEYVEAVNAISGERCSPHPHVFSDRALRPGDPVYYDILHSYMGYRTCYYRTFCVGSASRAMVDAYKRCRDYLDASIELIRPGRTTAEVASVWPRAQEFGFPSEEAAFALQMGHGIGLAIWERPMISRLVSLEHPHEIKPGMVFALETFWPSTRWLERRQDRGRNRRHANRPRSDHALSRRGAARRGSAIRHGRWNAADCPRDRGASESAGGRDDCVRSARRSRSRKGRRWKLMAVSVVMPALEMAQESGKLVSWLKKEGEQVRKGEMLLEVETDKAVVEVEASSDGILAGITAHPGDVIPVGHTIAWLVQPGESPPASTSCAYRQWTTNRRVTCCGGQCRSERAFDAGGRAHLAQGAAACEGAWTSISTRCEGRDQAGKFWRTIFSRQRSRSG